MGFHEAGFGAIVGDHGDEEALLRLLYREVIRFDMSENELPERNVFTDLAQDLEDEYSKLILVPYDDYRARPGEDLPLEPIEITGPDEFYEATSGATAVFEHDIRLFSVDSCEYFLGWGTVGTHQRHNVIVTEEQIMQLFELTKRLRSEGRWNGHYGLVRNCCS